MPVRLQPRRRAPASRRRRCGALGGAAAGAGARGAIARGRAAPRRARRARARGAALARAGALAPRTLSIRRTAMLKPANSSGASERSRRPSSAIWYITCTRPASRRAAIASTRSRSGSSAARLDARLRERDAMQQRRRDPRARRRTRCCARRCARLRAIAPLPSPVGDALEQRPDEVAADASPASRRPAPRRPCRRRARSPGRAGSGCRARCRPRPCASCASAGSSNGDALGLEHALQVPGDDRRATAASG